jgi:hypothetical protein
MGAQKPSICGWFTRGARTARCAAHSALAAAVLGGKIHTVGGIGWRGRDTPAHGVYDPAINRWTALAYVPTARDHLAAAGINGAPLKVSLGQPWGSGKAPRGAEGP